MEEVKEFFDTEEGLFDDLAEEVESMPTDETEAEESKVEETSMKENGAKETASVESENTPKENEPFLQIKYDKEDIALSKEEAKELAEMGKNYERLRDKYNNERAEIERLASLNGMGYEDFIHSLNDTQFAYEVSKEVQKLKETNPDVSEELLKELAERRVNEKLGDIQNVAIAKQQEQADAQRARLDKDIEKLKAKFEDFDVANLPDEVMNDIKEGMDLPSAYYKYRYETEMKNKPIQEAQAKVDKLNEENKKKSIGSTTNAGSEEKDDFLSGFLNG